MTSRAEQRRKFVASYNLGTDSWVIKTRSGTYTTKKVVFVAKVESGLRGELQGKFDHITEVKTGEELVIV
jgi:hypothetical protein